MNELFLNNIKRIAEKISGYLIDGNDNRQQMINILNNLYGEFYVSQYINRRCLFSITKGNSSFHNNASSFQYRSGIELKILNDLSITQQEIEMILFPILGNETVKRRLNVMGFDTLKVVLACQNRYLDFDLFHSIRSTLPNKTGNLPKTIHNKPTMPTTRYISNHQPPKQSFPDTHNTEYKKGDNLYYKKKK
ncbi:MAG: hypothetical protein Q4A00_06635 [Flavobacteriaceae bacterium]|nr:hypothetical protein [Flavobacteriaceae bacterium]